MVLFDTTLSNSGISINDSKDTNTGIIYVNQNDNLKHLKLIDRLLIKKYIVLLNKIQMINYEDRFAFVEEQATAVELLIDIQSMPIFQDYKKVTMNKIKNEITLLEKKLKRYEKDGLSEFERKKANIFKKNIIKEMIKPKETDDTHKELVKIISNFYK